MIKIKDGVDVRGLHSKIWDAIYLIEPFFSNHGTSITLTSALDGVHSHGSLHYVGCAVDIRIRDISFVNELFNLIKDLLPSGYDVVLEDTHIHIEWQPKNPSEL